MPGEDGDWLVIGYGNRLRGDDAFGPLVAEQLARAAPGVAVHALPALLPELAPALASVRRALFIDATLDLPPGTLAWRPLAPALSGAEAHGLEPSDLLELAACLYGRAPSARALCAGAVSLDFAQDTLSVPLQLLLEPAVAQALEALSRSIPNHRRQDT